ncbi:hypothetical protein [Alkaliphilus sp. B6464]|uniref:hypothetical protein n=1 Tax=Alkaliphilus sp. B6464 TaxID=2731219 RepID=UPI001BA9242E|nr:hypothetical protein [Alkaliphilus sp. B6464]QUH20193.1 hypothetical protein HYG84_09930 [Alkaliphilus sp. B6464]
MVTYSIPSRSDGITIITQLSAQRYGQETAHTFLKGAKAREFARGLRDSSVKSVLTLILGLTSVYTGIYAGVYTLYKQSIIDQIMDYSDTYPGVYIKVIDSTYGRFYAVEPWEDTSRATVSLVNSETTSERIAEVIRY